MAWESVWLAKLTSWNRIPHILTASERVNYRVSLEYLLISGISPERLKVLKKKKKAGSFHLAAEASEKGFPLDKTGIIMKIKYNNEL